MNRELDRSKASFKLDLMETANADPMVNPADLKVLAAYIAVMAWPSCKTWLAASLAMAMTGLSHGQFWKSRSRLLGENDEKRAYLIAVRQGGKVATYKLINPWRDEAKALVDTKLAYHREVERQRKAAKRSSPAIQKMEGQRVDLSLQILDGQRKPRPSRIRSSVPPEFVGNTPLEITPKDIGHEERPLGTNVVPFISPRKAS